MALDAVFFDVDGTLVDSNGLHVQAWQTSLQSHGYTIAPDRLFLEIGKGGDNLVPDLLGKQIDLKDGKSLRDAEGEEFKRLAACEGVRPFPQAAELIAALRERGVKTILATSGGNEIVEAIEKASGVEWRKIVDGVVTADDAKRSKPAPDLIHAAIAKSGFSPAQCAMVGDTPHDANASVAGGVVFIGVRSGGHTDATLRGTGARLVYADTSDMLAHLGDCLSRSSPGSMHWTDKALQNLMQEALRVAEQAMEAGEAPIGCVLARGDGMIAATGYNQQQKTRDKSAHAEIVTFAAAAGLVPIDARDMVLVCTLEPCVMCTGAAMIAGVDTIVYGLGAPADGGSHRVKPPHSPESQMPRIIGPLLADKSLKLFKKYLASNPPEPAWKYVEQLIASHR